ncbi:MAG: MazG family protein [Verrucomicrobia bacterium]|nr:MazG family protein [Verrucomicrobiota bacterium]
MEQFDSLLHVAEKLLGPNGCPWDQKQTFLSLQPYVLEEAHEVIEAVDADDDRKIVEELGDLLYTIVFYGKLAEKTGRFSILEIITAIREKLIRRHPHVFGEVKVQNADEVVKNWEQIKAAEKGGSRPASALDGIPPTLPSVVRAQKILKRMQRADSTLAPKDIGASASDEEIGDQLLSLILRAENGGVDAESALRRSLARIEEAFRESER